MMLNDLSDAVPITAVLAHTLIDELRDAIPVTKVPKHLPAGPNGRPTHLASIYRWHTRGRRGVKLQFTYVSGRTYVLRRHLEEWLRAQNPSTVGDPVGVGSPTSVGLELDRIGV